MVEGQQNLYRIGGAATFSSARCPRCRVFSR